AVDAVNVTASETTAKPVVLAPEVARPRWRSRVSPLRWVRRGGPTTLLFALPMLLVFTAFSWYPMVRLVIMSLQQTNLTTPAVWVGLHNFKDVWNDPLFPVAVKNTAY